MSASLAMLDHKHTIDTLPVLASRKHLDRLLYLRRTSDAAEPSPLLARLSWP